MTFESHPGDGMFGISIDALPSLESIDRQIAELQHQLDRAVRLRQALALLLQALEPATAPANSPRTEITGVAHSTGSEPNPLTPKSGDASNTVSNLGPVRLSAKDVLRVTLEQAGGPISLRELVVRASSTPDSPSPAALTNAFYHNTRSGARCFVALGNGLVGLAGRDEPMSVQPESDRGESPEVKSKAGSITELVQAYIRSHASFRSSEMVANILAQLPTAKPHSLRATLSGMQRQGKVSLREGVWHSQVYDDGVLAKAPPDSDDDAVLVLSQGC